MLDPTRRKKERKQKEEISWFKGMREAACFCLVVHYQPLIQLIATDTQQKLVAQKEPGIL